VNDNLAPLFIVLGFFPMLIGIASMIVSPNSVIKTAIDKISSQPISINNVTIGTGATNSLTFVFSSALTLFALWEARKDLQAYDSAITTLERLLLIISVLVILGALGVYLYQALIPYLVGLTSTLMITVIIYAFLFRKARTLASTI